MRTHNNTLNRVSIDGDNNLNKARNIQLRSSMFCPFERQQTGSSRPSTARVTRKKSESTVKNTGRPLDKPGALSFRQTTIAPSFAAATTSSKCRRAEVFSNGFKGGQFTNDFASLSSYRKDTTVSVSSNKHNKIRAKNSLSSLCFPSAAAKRKSSITSSSSLYTVPSTLFDDLTSVGTASYERVHYSCDRRSTAVTSQNSSSSVLTASHYLKRESGSDETLTPTGGAEAVPPLSSFPTELTKRGSEIISAKLSSESETAFERFSVNDFSAAAKTRLSLEIPTSVEIFPSAITSDDQQTRPCRASRTTVFGGNVVGRPVVPHIPLNTIIHAKQVDDNVNSVFSSLSTFAPNVAQVDCSLLRTAIVATAVKGVAIPPEESNTTKSCPAKTVRDLATVLNYPIHIKEKAITFSENSTLTDVVSCDEKSIQTEFGWNQTNYNDEKCRLSILALEGLRACTDVRTAEIDSSPPCSLHSSSLSNSPPLLPTLCNTRRSNYLDNYGQYLQDTTPLNDPDATEDESGDASPASSTTSTWNRIARIDSDTVGSFADCAPPAKDNDCKIPWKLFEQAPVIETTQLHTIATSVLNHETNSSSEIRNPTLLSITKNATISFRGTKKAFFSKSRPSSLSIMPKGEVSCSRPRATETNLCKKTAQVEYTTPVYLYSRGRRHDFSICHTILASKPYKKTCMLSATKNATVFINEIKTNFLREIQQSSISIMPKAKLSCSRVHVPEIKILRKKIQLEYTTPFFFYSKGRRYDVSGYHSILVPKLSEKTRTPIAPIPSYKSKTALLNLSLLQFLHNFIQRITQIGSKVKHWSYTTPITSRAIFGTID